MQTLAVSTDTRSRPRAPAPAEPAPSLHALASKALAAHGGDVAAATEALIEMLEADKALFRRVASDVVAGAARGTVQRVVAAERAAVVAGRKATAGRASVFALAEGMARSLMEFPLAKGVKLRDATGADVRAAASRYRLLSEDTGRKMRWLDAIAERVAPADRVSHVLDEATVKSLFDAA